jgi:shikimate kinase/3-dehydroquinate synthase
MIEIKRNIDEIKTHLNKPIVMVGMMGAGKTTVGKALAEKLGCPFYDSDDEIVRSAGKSISKIFEEEGEPAFRELERLTMQGLLKHGLCVIASGGGAISIHETAKQIIENGLCLWLDAPVDVLVERVKGTDRPLIQHGDPEEVLSNLLEKRAAAYGQAHLHILDDGLNPEEITNRILMQISEHIFAQHSDANPEKHLPQALCLTVSLFDRSYPIFIGAGLLENVDLWLSHEYKNRKAFIITDYNVRAALTDKFQQIITPHMKSVSVMELAPGEQTKSFDRFQAVVEWLIESGVKRDSLIFAVGGGVIGDLAGFAASTVLRGVDFIQVPTTLLSQVDSSVGGKTGINSRFGKNMIGAFYQPRAVVIDLDTLTTLPAREWLSGYAEIVKYGLLGDAKFFEWLEVNGTKMLDAHDPSVMRAIETSCSMKAEIVRQDEREENGLRALLNLGHTFGHALESLTGYSDELLHGEAVAIGTVLAARLSCELGRISQGDVDRITNHFKLVKLRTEIHQVKLPDGTTDDDIMMLMRKDKKASQQGMVFIVLNRIGEAELVTDVPENLVRKVIEDSM